MKDFFSLAVPVLVFEQVPYHTVTSGTRIMNTGLSPN